MPQQQEEAWRIKSECRCSVSGARIDSIDPKQREDTYTLNASEIPNLRSFQDSLGRLSKRFVQNQAILRAVDIYGSCSDVKSKEDEITDLFICLESLMLEQDEGLSFRLAQRTANLLGDTSESRRMIYKQLRDFYGLRSKIVHGSTLSNTQRERLKTVQSLRDIARRVVLAVLGICASIPLGSHFYAALDEMSLDEQKRNHLQTLAATHLLVSKGMVAQ
jgi:hypothetical protein